MRAAILSVSGPILTSAERQAFAKIEPWGVILMGRSCVSKSQVKRLVEDIWSALGRACLIFIDQEGGRVARLKAPEWPTFPRGEDYARVYQRHRDEGLEAAWLGHRLIAHELKALGIHADCAPVCDVRQPDAHDIVGDRAFGDDARQVGELAEAALAGLRDGGVAGVIKHIPGHGRAMVDSHESLPRVTAGENELAMDLAAFAAVAGAPMAMTAHIAYDAFDPGVAATLSPKVIQEVIRTRIGFDGLLMSDDLGMKALGGTLASRAEAALAAGCDVVLHCAGFEKDAGRILEEMIEVGEAATELSGKPLERARSAELAATHFRGDFDAEAGRSRLDALLNAGGRMV